MSEINNNNDGSNIKGMADINDDKRKEELKLIVIDAISKECMKNLDSTPHDDVCAVAKGLSSGRKLKLTILTGGLCNYSYKVHFEDDNSSPPEDDDIALFAKLSFKTPVMIPGAPSCSLERTQCEFDMMGIYSKVTPYPDSAITPYFCLDVIDGINTEDEEPMKVLVTEFSSRLQEQAANKFVEATMGKKFAIKLAKGLSSLHNTEVLEPDFNDGQKVFFHGLTNMLSAIFDKYLDEFYDNKVDLDGATKLAGKIGKVKLDEIMKVFRETVDRKDCYVHGDTHVFNMLVEDNILDNTGDIALVDWEMSHCGPVGKDIGIFYGFPLACVLAHAINGDTHSSENILHFLDALWKEYSTSIESDVELADIYRQILGFSSLPLIAYSAIGFHMEYLPIDDQEGVGAEDLEKVKESLGIIGLKFASTGFVNDNTMTLLELQNEFHTIVNEEIHHLLPKQEKETKEENTKKTINTRRRRRSSLLRETGRRVSDAHMYATLASDQFCVNDNVPERVEKLMIDLEE